MTTVVSEKAGELSAFFLPVFTAKADFQSPACKGKVREGMGQLAMEEPRG